MIVLTVYYYFKSIHWFVSFVCLCFYCLCSTKDYVIRFTVITLNMETFCRYILYNHYHRLNTQNLQYRIQSLFVCSSAVCVLFLYAVCYNYYHVIFPIQPQSIYINNLSLSSRLVSVWRFECPPWWHWYG